MKTKNEQWKRVNGYEEYYQISNIGRVKSLSRKHWNGYNYWYSKDKILKPYLDNRGYYVVSLRKNNKRKLFYIHRLVAQSFIPNLQNKPEVNHINKKTDNTLQNLEWVTARENMKHAFYNKRINHQGIKNGGSKLNEKQVKEIRKKYTTKDNYTKIGKKYNVSYQTISEIIRGKRWKHL